MILLPSLGSAARVMSDSELDKIVAGSIDAQVFEDVVRFHYLGAAGMNHLAELEGTLSLSATQNQSTTGLLIIDNGAQRNLSSLVNVSAVNSNVNVLLNLNININSTVGEMRQINVKSY